MRVIAYNIHQGYTRQCKKFVLGEIRDALVATGADVLCLQEVCGHSEHHSRKEEKISGGQASFLSEGGWPYWEYQQNATYRIGHHGNVVLSKLPLLKSDSIDLSVGNLEKRGLLAASISASSCLRVCSVHLGLGRAERREQLLRISEIVRTKFDGIPTIVAGDFNDWQRRAGKLLASHSMLRCAFGVTRKRLPGTFPSNVPLLPLDRAYVSGVEVDDVRVLRGDPWIKLSDHLPIQLDVSVVS